VWWDYEYMLLLWTQLLWTQNSRVHEDVGTLAEKG
jgi:hypothetical protein